MPGAKPSGSVWGRVGAARVWPLRADWTVTTPFGLPRVAPMSPRLALASKVAAALSGAREVVRV